MAYEIFAVWRRWVGPALVLLLVLGSTSPIFAGPSALPAPAPTAQGSYLDLDSPDPDVRAAAVQAIRQARDVAAVPLLIERLEDPDQRVGLYIAQALVELAPESALPAIRNAAWLTNADGRWRAAFVLGERKDVRAIPVLTYNLRHEEVLVHSTSANSLAKIGTTASANALILALRATRSSEANAAMRGLLAMGDEAVPFLAAVMESGDRDAELRAAIVLEMMGTPAARQALQPLLP